MQVRQINLDDEGTPETIVVRMTRDEALYLALLTGKQSGESSEAVMRGGLEHCGEIWGALCGDVFNRYYDDGAEGAARGDGTT